MAKWIHLLLLFFVIPIYGQSEDVFRVEVDYQLNQESIAVVTKGLEEFNTPFFGREKPISFALYLKDEDDRVVGGTLAWMRTGIQLLHIDTIWVAEPLRNQGFGKELMEAAENEGLKNGCTHAQLETLSFQAEGFYKKLGYRRIGVVKKLYGEHDAIYLRKQLAP